jgi:uncharacterized protein (UPF0264 family)
MDEETILYFTSEIHDYGLKSALAGSIREEQLQKLSQLGCDVVGVRGAACTGGDRNSGRIQRSAVERLKKIIENF